MIKHAFLLMPALLTISACASGPEGTFPSLAKRPAEDPANARQPSTPRTTASVLNGELAGKLARFEARIQKAAAAFNATLPAMRSRANAARGSARSSENWVDAHMKLSRLDRARADGVAAMAELDKLASEQMDSELAGEGPLYGPLLQQSQMRLSAIINAQSQEIDRLGRTIGY